MGVFPWAHGGTPTSTASPFPLAPRRLTARLHPAQVPTRSIAAFDGQEHEAFLVVCADGTFFKCRFDPVRGGEATRDDWQRFLFGEEEE